MQTGQFFVGGGLDRSELKPVSADDVSRQPSRNVIPRFFTMVNKTAEGFRETEYVEILIPGDPKSAPVSLVDENMKRRFAAQYAAWKAGQEQKAQGTPVELLVGTGAMLHQMRALHIHTVEALAELTDGQLGVIGMGARQLRERAKTFLDQKATADALAREGAKDAEIADLKSRLARLEGNAAPQAAMPAAEDGEEIDEGPVPATVPEGAVKVTANAPARRPPRKARGN